MTTSVADLPDDGEADQHANAPYRPTELDQAMTNHDVDQSKPFWFGNFVYHGDDDEREATVEEVTEAFGNVLKFTRQDEGAWDVQADWLDTACGHCESGILELQRDAVNLIIEWNF